MNRWLVFIVCGLLFAGTAFAEVRVWTDREGRSFEGEYLRSNGTTVTVRRSADGLTFEVPLTTLSDACQTYVARRLSAEAAPEERPDASEPSSTKPIYQRLTGENLLDNGDLERGSSRWDGDRDVVDLRDGKAMAIELDSQEILRFGQTYDRGDAASVSLQFLVKTSANYSGGGYTIRMIRPNGGFTYSDRNAPGRDWSVVTWDFDRFEGAEELTFEIEVKPGEGTIYFDDFILVKGS